MKKSQFKDKMDTLMRRLKWLFGNSGMISLGLEHFLAMVPATILVPLTVNKSVGGTVIDVSLALFASGLGTIVFTIFSKGKIPAYLGSSFAYIGLTIYLIDSFASDAVTPDMAYSYVCWAYLFSGAILLFLSALYKVPKVDRFFSFILPAAVVGPAISLIGLELSDNALTDSGFDMVKGLVNPDAAIVSLTTLAVIILASLIKHKALKNAAIVVGMFAGYIVYLVINGVPEEGIISSGLLSVTVPHFRLPRFTFPENIAGIFVAVIPSTFVVFTENIGRVTVINQMTDGGGHALGIFHKGSMDKLNVGLRSHGFSTIAATLIGSVPTTIYAENIAVMGIHHTEQKKDPDDVVMRITNPYSCFPYIIAAVFAMLFSFSGALQSFLFGIPQPVIGGMEMFLFGIISAPGIQLLVDQRVNYKKISNQIITAAVLISGVSGIEIDFGFVELKGMGLGFVVGIALNLLVQTLKWIGNISDVVTFDEVLEECLVAMIGKEKEDADKDSRKIKLSSEDGSVREVDASDLLLAMRGAGVDVEVDGVMCSADFALGVAKHGNNATITEGKKALFTVRKTANSLFVDILESNIGDDVKTMYLNDFPDAIDADSSIIHVDISKNIPMRKVRSLVRTATKK